MEKFMFFVIVGLLFLCLFMILINVGINILRQKVEKQINPAYWKDKIPKNVDDYVEPRYVYENLMESTKYLPKNGQIIGYRISPNLVIHSQITQKVKRSSILLCLLCFNGNLLEDEDIVLLQKNWEKISDLRCKSGNTPLNERYFWATLKDGLGIAHYKDITRQKIWKKSGAYPLILKLSNS